MKTSKTAILKICSMPIWDLDRPRLSNLINSQLLPAPRVRRRLYFLGLSDQLGTITAGKQADLVLLEANPFDDIHNTQKIRAVVVQGRYLDRAALDELLAHAESAAND